LDCVETVRTRASESIVFGLKSPQKSQKSLKNQVCNSSGRRSRRFESCHLDHKESTALAAVLSLCLGWRGGEHDLRSKCRFAFAARRSASSLVRRRACKSSRNARIPCHLDHKKPWKHYRFQGFLLCPLRSFFGGVTQLATQIHGTPRLLYFLLNICFLFL